MSPDAAAVGRFHVAEVDWAGVPVVVAGTGYTGEDGVEIAVPPSAAGGALARPAAGGHRARRARRPRHPSPRGRAAAARPRARARDHAAAGRARLGRPLGQGRLPGPEALAAEKERGIAPPASGHRHRGRRRPASGSACGRRRSRRRGHERQLLARCSATASPSRSCRPTSRSTPRSPSTSVAPSWTASWSRPRSFRPADGRSSRAVEVEPDRVQGRAIEQRDGRDAHPEVVAGRLELVVAPEVRARHPQLGEHRVVGVVLGDELELEVGEAETGPLPVLADLVDAVVDAAVADQLVAGVREGVEAVVDGTATLGLEDLPQDGRATGPQAGIDGRHVVHHPAECTRVIPATSSEPRHRDRTRRGWCGRAGRWRDRWCRSGATAGRPRSGRRRGPERATPG